MKKSIIAVSAASVALAAMPIAGVFAEGTQQDIIKVGLAESCVLALNTDGHIDGTGDNAGAWGTDANVNTLSGDIANGQVANAFGSSQMIISCNHSTGYAVTAVATALEASSVTVDDGEGGTTKATIPLNASFSDTNSGWAYKVTQKGDNMTTNASNWTATANNTELITGDAPVSKGTFTVLYGVGVSATQPADTYTGTITYTISAVTPAQNGD